MQNAQVNSPMPAANSTPAATPKTRGDGVIRLPACCATPDGMAIDQHGLLVVSCPNFADPKRPACLLKVDTDLTVRKWVDVPPLAETGLACSMGIAFGPDWSLYVCDNQNWATGNGPAGELNQGRLLRLFFAGETLVKTTVVASGMSHPNGVRVHDGHVYVTVSVLPKIKNPDGLLVSGVYRFALEDANIAVTNTLADPNLLLTLVTRNRDCQYGADGIAFAANGMLHVGNFGDGAIHRYALDVTGRVTREEILAKTDLATPLAAPDFREKMVQARMRSTDGIFFDTAGNLYVADFSNNAVSKVDPAGRITVFAQSPDGDGLDGGLNQPGEPIIWNDRLLLACFGMVTGPDKVALGHREPATLAWFWMKEAL